MVPIVLVIVGWIVSFWFTDTRIGNPPFMGWTLFYTAIVCFFLGIATFGGKDGNGNPIPKNRHHFFYIPIVFWALIFGGLSAYLLLAAGKTSGESSKEELAVADTIPKIHFYNPTGDTLDYLIYTKDGLSEQESLAPFTTSEAISLPGKSYVLGALDTKGEATMTLPYYEKYDASLYERVNEDGRTIEQRLIRPLSKPTNDYEDNWMLLNGDYDMILVDVTEIYSETIKEEKIPTIDWMKKIKSRHTGSELIELSIAPSSPEGSVYVSSPNTYLPVSNPKGRSVYMLITFRNDEEVTNDFIRESVELVTM